MFEECLVRSSPKAESGAGARTWMEGDVVDTRPSVGVDERFPRDGLKCDALRRGPETEAVIADCGANVATQSCRLVFCWGCSGESLIRLYFVSFCTSSDGGSSARVDIPRRGVGAESFEGRLEEQGFSRTILRLAVIDFEERFANRERLIGRKECGGGLMKNFESQMEAPYR